MPDRTPSAPAPSSSWRTAWRLPRGSLARLLVFRLMLPVMVLVLLDLVATWLIFHKLDVTVGMLEYFFWPMVVGQVLLIVSFAGVVIQGVRSGLRSINALADAIRQRSIDDMQPMAVAGLPAEIAPLVTHINDLLGRLDASLSSQRRFIGHAAHQLRTPLSGLRMESELMLARPLPDDVRIRAERIKAVSDRMIRMSQQLLALARANPDTQLRDHFVRLDLCEWVRASGAEWIPRARAAQIDMDLVAPDISVDIDGDPLLLDELLGNLIDNALRYGKPRGRIVLTVSANPPSLTVEDDGPGIPSEERERVFDAFYRLPGAAAGGSGLGLAIVREIAHAHGAWCKLTSRPEYPGTQLTIVFPSPRKGSPLLRHERHA